MKNFIKNLLYKTRFCSIHSVKGIQSYCYEKNYMQLSKEGYEKNIIVYRCVSLIARSIASVPLVVYEHDHEKQDHAIQKLLQKPNIHMNYHAFMESLTSSYLLSGNVYILGLSTLQKTISSLQILRPDRMSISLSDKGYIRGYQYQNNQYKQFYSTKTLLHIRSYHPTDDLYGLSPIAAASYAIDQHNAVAQHNLSLLENGGRPSGALMVEDSFMSDEQRQKIREELSEFYAGGHNAGKILLLEGPFKWQEMGLSPKDMDFIAGKNVSACEISSAFGVSPILVGLTEKASYSNYQEARLQLWEDTVIPLLNHFVSSLNNWLHNFFPDHIRIGFNLDAIPALASRREETWSKLQDCDFLTLNEKRKAIGYSPVKE